MAEQTVVWTALPNGVTGDPADRRLRLSVFISPRLVSDGPGPTLAEFADFLDWPARLRVGQVAFSVQARTAPDDPPGQPVPANIVSPPPDSDLWTALFSRATPVESHRPDDLSGRPISSYSISAVHAQIKQGHQALAVEAPVEGPSVGDLGRSMAVTAAFTPMSGDEQVVSSIQPPEEMAPSVLRGVLSGLATNMFRPDGVTDLSQRVEAAVTHARALARLALETPVHVLPPAEEMGLDDPVAKATSEFARLVAFARGPVATPPAAAPAAATPTEGAPTERTPPETSPPAFDFHRGLTLLADHSALMRMLGLVIDLEIPAGSVPLSASGAPAPGQLRVVPAFTVPLEGGSVSPYTAYLLEGDRHGFFSAAPDPASPDIVHGLLDLRHEDQFELVQLDVHGGGLKLVTTLAGAARAGSPEDSGDDSGAVPAMRTSGVSIARSAHADRLMGRVRTAAANNAALASGEAPVLFAQDLVRGYRFDVLDPHSQAWRSLHQRVGTYAFRQHAGGPRTLTIHDEGAVQHAVTQPVGADGVTPDPDAEVYIHESLVTWQGWSLAAPRPGKAINDDGPSRVVNTAPEGFPQLDVAFQAEPGSLPRLRFGQRYRFRARAVDLAGNGLTLAEATSLLGVLPLLGLDPPDLPSDQEDFTYRRFEPVTSPVLVPRARFGEGEALERLVIRSRSGVPAAQEAADLTALVGQGRPDAGSYAPTSERHVVPPKTSQLTAETHGLFDGPIGTQTGFRETYHIARKERGRLTDTAIVDIATGQEVPVEDPGSIETVPTGQVGGNGYVVHREAQLALPYLPDPMARGAALFGLPGVPPNRPAGVLDAAGQLRFVASSLPAEALAGLGGSTVHIGFGEAWPQRLPFRLVLAEPPAGQGPDAAPTWDPATRTLTVFLGPAEQRTFRLSSFISLEDLERLGQWQWLLEMDPGSPPDPGALEAALQGTSWMLTPARTITLVHAVEQPLVAPEISGLRAPRDYGATFSYLGADVAVDGQSTAKLDVLAAWTEEVDPPGAPPKERAAPVLDIAVNLDDEPPPESPDVVPVATHDPRTSVLTIQAPVSGDESGRTFLARHEFGDTKGRRVRYQAVASTRFREYFPSEVTGQPDRLTLVGRPVEVMVASSARPAAPRVVSVLPTFQWLRQFDEDGNLSILRRGGVRVYLERPWFSSGDGELLAVVLANPADYPPDEELEPFVTHWGRDPVWAGEEPLSPPGAADFLGATGTASGLPLEERTDVTVMVVAHEVRHDPERDLLYCDIAVNGAQQQTYAPFLRLALARYQPNSLPGVELSRVVLADFVQIASDRGIRVEPEAGNPDGFRVEVGGLAPAAVPIPGLPVEVAVEQRLPGTSDDLGWTAVAVDTPGVAVTRTPRWDWRACGGCGGLAFVAGGTQGPCASGGTHHTTGRRALALRPAAPDAPGQHDWRLCGKCQLLAFAGSPGSVCAAGGAHDYNGGADYALDSVPVTEGWDEWRRCDNCHGLVLAESPPANICAAGGGRHVVTGGADYVLDQATAAPAQRDWVLCGKCGGLFFALGSPSVCPADGTHFRDGNPEFGIASGPDAPGDHHWRWCRSCQAMAYQDDDTGVCPAGGAHDLSASGDYGIVAMPYIRGVSGWRWCRNCQSLTFKGSVLCPAGGEHDTGGSGNYVLPVNPAEPAPGVALDPSLWSGRVGLPSARAAGQYRIVIREFEPIATDEPGSNTGRLVFAETVEL
jgi:hypothetical protein